MIDPRDVDPVLYRLGRSRVFYQNRLLGRKRAKIFDWTATLS